METISPGAFLPDSIKDFYPTFAQGEWKKHPAIWDAAKRLVTDSRMERVYQLVAKNNLTNEEWRIFFDLAAVGAGINFLKIRDEAETVAGYVQELAKPLGEVIALLQEIGKLPRHYYIPEEIDNLRSLLIAACRQHPISSQYILGDMKRPEGKYWPPLESIFKIMSQAVNEYEFSTKDIEHFPGVLNQKPASFAEYIRRFHVEHQNYFKWKISNSVLFDLAVVATGDDHTKADGSSYGETSEKASVVRGYIRDI